MDAAELHRRFVRIRDEVAAGRPAALTLDIGGQTYVRTFLPGERLILLGAGHVAQSLCRYAADLGFRVTAADDRPDFACRSRFPEAEEILCASFPEALERLAPGERDCVAVLTRGHRCDADCLRHLLAGPFPRYLGMIGSRRRVAGLFALLEQEGFPREKLQRIHAPIGVDIGAVTVQEIGISIAAQLVQCRRAGRDRTPGRTRLPLETADPVLLDALADPAPKALLLVYETEGSTPTQAGALMTVDRSLRTLGTIGGGCAEGAAIRQAFRLIGSGGHRLTTVDLNRDLSEEMGMVCGGRMKLFLQDLS